jgi:hypothetical protein
MARNDEQKEKERVGAKARPDETKQDAKEKNQREEDLKERARTVESPTLSTIDDESAKRSADRHDGDNDDDDAGDGTGATIDENSNNPCKNDDDGDGTGGTFPVASQDVLKGRKILVARSADGQLAAKPSANINLMGGTGTNTAASTKVKQQRRQERDAARAANTEHPPAFHDQQ